MSYDRRAKRNARASDTRKNKAAAGLADPDTWTRKGHTLTVADTIVAAIAIEHGCASLTDNRKDFPMPEVQLYPLP